MARRHIATIRFRRQWATESAEPNAQLYYRRRVTFVQAKAKAYNTCIAPQAAYRSCSGAVHVTDRAGVQPIDRRSRTGLRQTGHTQSWSAV